MATEGCWVDFYEHTDFARGHIRFNGPIEVRKLDDYKLNNQKSAGDDIDSLRTDPNAWLEVYEDEDFEDTLKRFGPSTEIRNLDEHGIGDNIDSFALFDQAHPGGPAPLDFTQNGSNRETGEHLKQRSTNRSPQGFWDPPRAGQGQPLAV